MNEKDCKITVLVCSCDKYEDAWDPFFKLFHIQWPDCHYPIVLNTESKNFNCSYMKVTTLCGGKNIPWSKRLRNVLNQIKTEFILFFLEDFFLMSPVNIVLFNEALDIIQNDSKIGFISFNPDLIKTGVYWKTDKCYNENYAYISKKSLYRINAQANIWRVKYLKKVLKNRENAWEFEVYGTLRAKFFHQATLSRKINSPLVFDYHAFPGYGYGIKRGQWLPKNKELFDIYGIKVNFDNLGWYDSKKKMPRHKRKKGEILKLLYKNPVEFISIIKTKIRIRFSFLKAFF